MKQRREIDLHEGIDSTLMILQNRLKRKDTIPDPRSSKNMQNFPLIEVLFRTVESGDYEYSSKCAGCS
jgi:hypothetical protein